MSAVAWLLVLLPVAYLLGSVPFGLLIARARGVNIRKVGSGNIGATNVGRSLGTRWFFVVLLLDLLKSALPLWIASAVVFNVPAPDRGPGLHALWLAVGIAALLGHVFSLFLGFKGGKGVATSAGITLGLVPYWVVPGMAALAVFAGVFKLTRYVSVGSMLAAGSFPLVFVGLGLLRGWAVFGALWPLTAAAVAIPCLIVWTHRSNIRRLLAGTEQRYESGRQKDAEKIRVPPGQIRG
ncbi:MAG: glycerol-3-phosphate 1-O-acyltransferase PlsY [Phycisphaerae bacterium]